MSGTEIQNCADEKVRKYLASPVQWDGGCMTKVQQTVAGKMECARRYSCGAAWNHGADIKVTTLAGRLRYEE